MFTSKYMQKMFRYVKLFFDKSDDLLHNASAYDVKILIEQGNVKNRTYKFFVYAPAWENEVNDFFCTIPNEDKNVITFLVDGSWYEGNDDENGFNYARPMTIRSGRFTKLVRDTLNEKPKSKFAVITFQSFRYYHPNGTARLLRADTNEQALFKKEHPKQIKELSQALLDVYFLGAGFPLPDLLTEDTS